MSGTPVTLRVSHRPKRCGLAIFLVPEMRCCGNAPHGPKDLFYRQARLFNDLPARGAHGRSCTDNASRFKLDGSALAYMGKMVDSIAETLPRLKPWGSSVASLNQALRFRGFRLPLRASLSARNRDTSNDASAILKAAFASAFSTLPEGETKHLPVRVPRSPVRLSACDV